MSILEIVHLRSSAEPISLLGQRVSESLGAQAEDLKLLTLYRRQGLDTDLAVHIHHGSDSGIAKPSTVATRLASALREYGLVEHTIWEAL